MNIDLTKKETCSVSHDFNTYLVNKEKYSNILNTNTLPAKIHFYEWSKLDSFKYFETDKDFFDFMRKCSIWTTYQEDKNVKGLSHIGDGAFVVCKPGTKSLLVESSLEALEVALEECEKNKTTVTTTSTSGATQNNYPAVCGQGYNPAAYAYGRYGEYDDCWD